MTDSDDKTMGPADIRRILNLLPHRYPMLLVDRVESMVRDTSIHAVKAVTIVYFMGIDGVKFRKPVEPGHLLDLHVTILQAKRNICKFEGRAMLGDQLATECQFTAMIADPPND